MSVDRYIKLIRATTEFYDDNPADQELREFLENPLTKRRLDEILSSIYGLLDEFRHGQKVEHPFGPRKSEDYTEEKVSQYSAAASLGPADPVDQEGAETATLKKQRDSDLDASGEVQQQPQSRQTTFDADKRPESPELPVAGVVDSKHKLTDVKSSSPELPKMRTPAAATLPIPALLKKEGSVSRPPSRPEVRFNLPNARVGEAYDHEVVQHGKDCVVITEIQHLEKVGLRWNELSQRVIGVPTRVGSHKVSVIYAREGVAEKWLDDTVELTVISDPKDLWKDIPSNPSEPFWKPDSADNGVKSGSYLLAGASRRGRSHAHTGSCRDDDFILVPETKKGWRILAVADGAGSAKFSRKGSKVAVQVSSDLLAGELDSQDDDLLSTMNAWHDFRADEHRENLSRLVYSVFRKPVYEVVKTIHNLAKQSKSTTKDFYTTLLIGAHKEVDGRHYVVGYWRGDGAMALLNEGSYLNLMGTPDGGEYAGQTRFMDAGAAPQEDIQARVRFDVVDNMSALLLLTDGVTDPLFESVRDLNERAAWDRYWKEKVKPHIGSDPAASGEALRESLDFWSRGNHDDRTIAVLYKKDVSNPEEPAKGQSAELKQDSEPVMEEVETETEELIADESNAASLATGADAETDQSAVLDANGSSSEYAARELAEGLNINETSAAGLPVKSDADRTPAAATETAASALEKSIVNPEAVRAESMGKGVLGDDEN